MGYFSWPLLIVLKGHLVDTRNQEIFGQKLADYAVDC